MPKPTLVVTIEANEERRQIIAEVVRDEADVVFLQDIDAADKRDALKAATAIFSSPFAPSSAFFSLVSI